MSRKVLEVWECLLVPATDYNTNVYSQHKHLQHTYCLEHVAHTLMLMVCAYPVFKAILMKLALQSTAMQ